jgi:AcrR family transcriptional regulator
MLDNIHLEKADKREVLLAVAERLFAQHGFEAVSVRQLATEAGTNVAMVSYYFGSKDGLFQELIASRFPYTRGFLEGLANNKEITPWEKLSRTIDMYVDKFFAGRAFHCVIMREISLQQRPEHVRIITDHMGKNMELIRGFIQEGQESGQFHYVDADFAIVMLFGAMSSYVNNSTLVCKMLKETTLENIYSDANKVRFKNELKSMLQSHLMREIAGR